MSGYTFSGQEDNFAPGNTQVTEDQVAEFVQSEITGNLREVPGIGPATQQILFRNDIETTHVCIHYMSCVKYMLSWQTRQRY